MPEQLQRTPKIEKLKINQISCSLGAKVWFYLMPTEKIGKIEKNQKFYFSRVYLLKLSLRV